MLLFVCLVVLARPALAADWNFNYGTGSGQYNTWVKLVNPTGSAIYVAYKNYGGTGPVTASGIQFIWSTWGKTLSNGSGSQALLGGWNSPVKNCYISVPANSTVGLPACFQWPGGSTAVSGADNWTMTFPVYADGVLSQTYSFTKTMLITSGGGGYLVAGTSGETWSYGGTAAPVLGTITLGPPPDGSVTVVGLWGNFHAVAQIDGVVYAELDIVPITPQAVAPNWVFTKTPPSAWAGKELLITVNGAIQYRAPVVLTGGTFTYVISAIPWEYQQRLSDNTDPGVDLPMPDGGLEENATDTGHPVVPAVAPIPGADPTTDNTSDSDGAGSGTGLSVKDMYRAMRRALEDANNNNGGTDFDINRWKGDGMGGDARADGLGSAGGDALTAMAAASGVGSGGWNLGTGATPGIAIPVFGQIMTVPLINGVGWVRVLLLVFVTIWFFLALVRLVRGAVTTPD